VGLGEGAGLSAGSLPKPGGSSEVGVRPAINGTAKAKDTAAHPAVASQNIRRLPIPLFPRPLCAMNYLPSLSDAIGFSTGCCACSPPRCHANARIAMTITATAIRMTGNGLRRREGSKAALERLIFMETELSRLVAKA